MKRILGGLRHKLNEEQFNNPNVIGDKSSELKDTVLSANNNEDKITLDNNLDAKVISDSNDIPSNVINGLQSVLNNLITAVQGSINNIDLLTVHISNTTMVITFKVTMTDNQPMIFNINTVNQSVQAKYDNFLELTPKNLQLLTQIKQYFNPRVMSQLQGATVNGS
jgi:hypothetical protein